ncbi:glycosyltransferase [Paenibacillus sp. P96]|uniref:Glycosyltransferase n=1 Tax=Paenibacillus zeirhizosphaerae TaxID=2987519 RepID=A0ABT9FXG1_9BACL|nr:glycosyltransferase [Paenibacillus sp. P96]MDP4099407.1 glycosyltransferase [Paenibacillus sp. P96]
MSIQPGFKQLGEGSYVHPGGVVEGTDYISVGRQVVLPAPHWINVQPGVGIDEASPPVLSIGDGCRIGPGLTIDASNSVKLESKVMIGKNVYITDKIPYEVGDDPLQMGYKERAAGELIIGEGTLVDSGAVVEGNLRIGRGCIIRPNSVVLQDVPDYCEVLGSPARVIKVFMPHLNNWAFAADEEEAKKLLEQRSNHPLLSICIPTYNRAANLDQCLLSIFSQIGETPFIQVDVSDNASTDGTPDVVQRYLEKYSNLRYSRNDTNLGADRNVLKVLDGARGSFIKLQGDDDYFVPGTISPLLSAIQLHSDCGVIHINVLNGDGRIIGGEGAESYLGQISYAATFMTAMILRREDWHRLEDKTRFIDSSLNQFYLQFAILCDINPKYAIINSSMFTYAGNPPNDYNMGEVFVRGYLDILGHFEGRGLSEEAIKRDKERLMRSFLMPAYHWNRRHFAPENTAGFEEVFTEYYKDEPYYQELLEGIRSAE